LSSSSSRNLDSLNTEDPITRRLLQNAAASNGSNGFPGLEKKEPEEEDLVKYRAYSTSNRKYNKQDIAVYDSISLYELHVRRYPVNKQAYSYHQLHPNEQPAKMTGGLKRVTLIQNYMWYSESGTDYIVLPTKLIKRRFTRNITEDEIFEFIEDSKREDSGIDIMLEQPIPGIAPIREILSATAEEHIMHPAVALGGGEGGAGDLKLELDDQEITYEPVECSYFMDCPIDYSFHEFDKPQIFILGESIHSEGTKEARVKYKERRARVKKIKLRKTFLKAMNIMGMTLSVLNTLDEMDMNREQIRKQALAELEKQEKQKT
jgi:hypothetical protein